jgi:hypothetical protein
MSLPSSGLRSTPSKKCEAGSKQSSEISADFHRTIQHYIPADRTLHSHHCKNLKSSKGYVRFEVLRAMSMKGIIYTVHIYQATWHHIQEDGTLLAGYGLLGSDTKKLDLYLQNCMAPNPKRLQT